LKKMINIEIINQKNSNIIQCKKGRNLYDVLSENNLMDAPCGGVACCGKCKVKVFDSPFQVTEDEAQFLSEAEIGAGWCLACTHTAEQDLKIELPPKEKVAAISCKGFLKPFKQNVNISKTLNTQGNTEVWIDGRPAATESGDTRDKLYGIAVDIGTTTVVASLVDLSNGKELLSMSCLNSQKVFGQDVITRINFAMTHDRGTWVQQKTITKDLQTLIQGIYDEFNKTSEICAADVYEITIGANNTMVHLLAGIDPSSMGTAPYLPAFEGPQILNGFKDLGLPVNPLCSVYCLPAVSSFVGGDITAGILACGIHQQNNNVLFIDIGTNGEMVLSQNGQMCACSCAAGPALEGMNISCGVRAADGAIEDVQIIGSGEHTEVKLSVIGDCMPTGLCGSGILSVVAELNRSGILHKSGRLNAHPLVDKIDGKKRFYLSREYNIYITQNDIRQVQLAKGAILSGIQTMLEYNGMADNDIDEVVVAGQFGTHLKAESLTGAGLIPQDLEDKVKYVGNTSKSGAYLCLMAKDERQTIENLAEKIDYIELSRLEGYDNVFVKAMNFA
jgi:uncharacterized 2Fe-2S/4Fe-4S cluster protein (DUF4445 family)